MKPLTYRQIERLLKISGFRQTSSRGSHFKWEHPDGRSTIVPHHSTHALGQGLLNAIFAQAGIEKPQR